MIKTDLLGMNAIDAAKYLLGKFICTKDGKKYCITDVEAYFDDGKTGPNGKDICYHHGKFRSSGKWCVYGGMLLISCGSADTHDNVLIRGVDCISGPWNVRKTLLNDTDVSGESVIDGKTLWIEDHNVKVKEGDLDLLPRVRVPNTEKLRFKAKAFTYPF